jgi:hypothetical protein
VPLAAAAVTVVAHPDLERLIRTLLVFDAAGLGLFRVSGTVKALHYGVGTVAAITIRHDRVGGERLRAGTRRDRIRHRVLALHRHWRPTRLEALSRPTS